MWKVTGFVQTKKHANLWEFKYLHNLQKKQNTWQSISPRFRNVLASREIFPKSEHLKISSCSVLQNSISILNMFHPRRVRKSSDSQELFLPTTTPPPSFSLPTPWGISRFCIKEMRERRLSGNSDSPKGDMYHNSYAKGYREGCTANINVSIWLHNHNIL